MDFQQADTGDNDYKRDHDVRKWLRQNRYDDVAEMIDSLLAKWKAEGKKTRRNWWEVLAGTTNGEGRVVDGVQFPVLKAARERQGLALAPSAVSRTRKEIKVVKWKTNRWPEK
jgi:hypothetical protein